MMSVVEIGWGWECFSAITDGAFKSFKIKTSSYQHNVFDIGINLILRILSPQDFGFFCAYFLCGIAGAVYSAPLL